jgi:cyanophycinase
MHRQSVCLLALAACAQTPPKPAPPKPYEYYLTGNAADVQPATQPGFVLMGGGKDVDAAFRWMLRKAGGGDVVVLRASGGDGYNQYIHDMGADSVESLVVKTPEAARDAFVLEKIRHAEALWIAGGDQWNYVSVWGASPVRAEIQALIDRGVPVGGTSAGLAVLGQFVFTAEHDSVTSAQALADPFDERVKLGEDFVKIPALRGVITDTHFVKRDRLGRLLTFLARILADGKATDARAIAVDERTAALVESNGAATIDGEGPVYFLQAAAKPEICRPGKPLTFAGVNVYRVRNGGSFDLKTWTGRGGATYQLSVRDGVITSTQPGGAIY